MKKRTGDKEKIQIGIISDTHGLLRPEAVDALLESDLIIHAGDVGKISILDELNDIAPVVAVRGNMDSNIYSPALKNIEIIKKYRRLFYVIHDINRLDLEPAASGIDILVNGHTHRPLIEKHANVMYINPGSAGPRRPSLPVSVAILQIQDSLFNAKIIELKV